MKLNWLFSLAMLSGCLTAAAELRFGTAAALAVAGAAALVFSLVVARGRR